MNLRQQVGVATGALCLFMVLAVAFGAAVVGERQARENATDDLSAVAFSLADRLERGVNARIGSLELLAGLKPLKGAWLSDPDAVRAVLDDTLGTLAGVAWIGFADSAGTVLSATNGIMEGQSVANESWFRKGLEGPALDEIRAGDDPLHRLFGPSSNGSPRQFLDMAVPVTDASGKVIGVLALIIDWTWMDDLRRSALERFADTNNPELEVLSSDGGVLLGAGLAVTALRPEVLASMFEERRGSFTEDGTAGEILVGFAATDPQSQVQWLVVARQPAAIAFGDARALVWTIVILGILVAAIGILLAILIASRVARPIDRLTEEANRLDRYSVDMLPRVRGSREVVELSSALRSLLLRIGFAEQQAAQVEMRAADDARRFSHDLEVLRGLADMDVLTRLLNRRSFLAFATDAMEHHRRYRRNFAILMIDIDRFKSVNDALGHAAGDTVIRWVAGLIGGVVRPTDKAARFGGEEFIVLLHEVTPDEARVTAERIRQSVAAHPASFNGDDLFVTVSVGVSVAREADPDIEEVIARADLALYAAKGSGRNAVATAPVAKVQAMRRTA